MGIIYIPLLCETFFELHTFYILKQSNYKGKFCTGAPENVATALYKTKY